MFERRVGRSAQGKESSITSQNSSIKEVKWLVGVGVSYFQRTHLVRLYLEVFMVPTFKEDTEIWSSFREKGPGIFWSVNALTNLYRVLVTCGTLCDPGIT